MYIVHLRQQGGIGDQIAGLAFIQEFNRPDIELHLYTKFPEIAKIFLPWCQIHSREHLNITKPAWWIDIIDVVRFYGFVSSLPNEFVGAMALEYLRKIGINWAKLILEHPYTCNQIGHLAVGLGLRRWDLCHWLVGLEYRPFKYDCEGMDIGPFITVHDGFDSGHKFDVSMKSWPLEHWGSFISKFKKAHPGIQVIQLGGEKHRKIPNVDKNLAGTMPFQESLRYLKSSLLHIDGDSGLVHARHLFNKPSIVVFGPTNVEYFGYPENVNIAPKFCGDCWWLAGNWMQFCVKGYPSAKCMESTLGDDVLREANLLLR